MSPPAIEALGTAETFAPLRAALESAFMDIIETPTRLYVPANPQVTFAGDGTAFVECVMVIEP
jgi:hypothetical protein